VRSPRATGSRAKQSLRLWLRLLSTHNLVEQHIRRRLQERFARTLPQFDVLSELEHAQEAQTMSQLSRHLMVSNGNLTGVVERLHREGLVNRQVSATDRRVQLVSLTASGREQFQLMAQEHAAWLEELFADLDLPALDATLDSIHTLRDKVRDRIARQAQRDPV
jgi:DNA-binding MarR family transcriptional regulator